MDEREKEARDDAHTIMHLHPRQPAKGHAVFWRDLGFAVEH